MCKTVACSTVAEKPPQKKESSRDVESREYDPYQHRNLSHPTTDVELLTQLLKDLPSFLTMPYAFANGGLWFGLVTTFFICFLYTYCLRTVVKSTYILCKRNKVPSLTYAEYVETAFSTGPKGFREWANCIRIIVNALLVFDFYGCCCVYNVMIATDLQQLAKHYFAFNLDIRMYILVLMVPLIPISLIRNLKNLAPFSTMANILMAIALGITMYYLCIDLPPISDRPAIGAWHRLPLLFGTAIFGIEGIGATVEVGNNMKNPSHFIGFPGVLYIGMAIEILVFAMVGFLGYLAYGDQTADNITLNLPMGDTLAESVKLAVAVAVFFIYPIQFYLPLQIIWNGIKGRFPESKQTGAEYVTRISLVILSVAIAIAIPTIGSFTSLIGGICLGCLGLILPSIIEIIIYQEEPGLRRFSWIFLKNVGLIILGIITSIFITYVSIQGIIEQLSSSDNLM